jgi:hypothetical protein
MHRRAKIAGIQHIASHETKSGMRICLLEESVLARGEVVVADHVVALAEEAIDQVAPDEAGASGYEATQRVHPKTNVFRTPNSTFAFAETSSGSITACPDPAAAPAGT